MTCGCDAPVEHKDACASSNASDVTQAELLDALQNLVSYARAHGLDEAGDPVHVAEQLLAKIGAAR